MSERSHNEHLGAVAEQPLRCPYCGESGNDEWFRTHEHPYPFGDEEEQ